MKWSERNGNVVDGGWCLAFWFVGAVVLFACLSDGFKCVADHGLVHFFFLLVLSFFPSFLPFLVCVVVGCPFRQ